MATLPRWNDPSLVAGTMIRGALWLVSEVGQGNVFTKEDVRKAFPGVSQADRRIRDLRDYGWIIHASTSDASLLAEEQRFVQAGIAVWDPAERGKVTRTAISEKERLATMRDDGYQCVMCGVAGGETYPDSSKETAVLAVTRKPYSGPSGEEITGLITECKRCRSGKSIQVAHAPSDLVRDLLQLDEADQDRFFRWADRGRRGPTPLDRAWNAYRRLPSSARDQIRADFNERS